MLIMRFSGAIALTAIPRSATDARQSCGWNTAYRPSIWNRAGALRPNALPGWRQASPGLMVRIPGKMHGGSRGDVRVSVLECRERHLSRNRPGPAMWDERYREEGFAYGREPNDFLRGMVERLPAGKTLCLAEGEGRKARGGRRGAERGLSCEKGTSCHSRRFVDCRS